MTEALTAVGYGSILSLDGDALTVAARGAGKMALGTISRAIPLSTITAIEFRPARALTNGAIRVVTDEGLTIVNFLKKHQATMTIVFEAIQQRTEQPVGDVANGPFASDGRRRREVNKAAYESLRAQRADQQSILEASLVEQRTKLVATLQGLGEARNGAANSMELTGAVLASELRQTSTEMREVRDEFVAEMHTIFSDGPFVDEAEIEPDLTASRLASYIDSIENVEEFGDENENDDDDDQNDADISAAHSELRSDRETAVVQSSTIKSSPSAHDDAQADSPRHPVPSRRDAAAAAAAAKVEEIEREVDRLLDLAKTKAKAGEVVGEENSIRSALGAARRGGGRKAVKALEARIGALEFSGALRIGSRFFGVIKSESGFAQYSRKGSIWKIHSGAKEVVIRSDRITSAGVTHAIDRYTHAQVFLDGQMQITQRPSLTTMALLSPLPGSALIPGLVFQKKEKNDSRIAKFQISSVGWSVSVPVPPDAISHPRQMADRINAAASEIEFKSERVARRQVVNTSAAVASAPAHSPSGNDLKAQLARLEALVADGTITENEAQRARLIIITR